MAHYALIDDYLASLRAHVSWRRDVEDLIAEIEDHLHSAVARLESRGVGHAEAQQQTLARFGDPAVLARAFASTPEGGFAVPTTFTRAAGTMAIISSVLWIAFAVMSWLALWLEQRTGQWEGPAQWVGGLSVLVLVGAAGLTVGLLIGLHRRHGGLGSLGTAGIGIAAVGALASVLAWALPIWGSLLIVGTALVAVAVRDRDIAPQLPVLLLGGGLAVGGVTWTVLRGLEVGTPNVWGDYMIVNLTGVTIGAVLVAVGLYGVGAWLRSEEPADIDQPDIVMPA